jgi:hypothetical protein
MFTLLLSVFPKLTKLFFMCRSLCLLCFSQVLFLLFLGVGFEFNLISFWGCLKFILHAFVYFIRSLRPSRMRSSRLFTYPLTELLETRQTSYCGSFYSYCHVGVNAILEKVIQVNERFLPTLGSLWRMIGFLGKILSCFLRSPFSPLFG